jgi:hypothetical protein
MGTIILAAIVSMIILGFTAYYGMLGFIGSFSFLAIPIVLVWYRRKRNMTSYEMDEKLSIDRMKVGLAYIEAHWKKKDGAQQD